ncbi:MAG TPA: class I SAM-dependent methyltransferase [Phycisphaerae bacterium]|nr:class I SAM-dependent methyltransferase [Phycisphaerae bacterium]
MAMSNNKTVTEAWYDRSYSEKGFNAQRLYPNEELLRFFGRHFFGSVPLDERKVIRVLEIGCGSCSNLWMIAHEGFDAYGVDISAASLELGGMMLKRWGVTAKLTKASMTDLSYEDGFFDVVADVFSSYCLGQNDFGICLDEVARVLKNNGRFFSYTPSCNSDAFQNYRPAGKIDKWTLDGIRRKSSPFYGNNYPFRFTDSEVYRDMLTQRGLEVDCLETVERTYGNRTERFEFLVVDAQKRQ